MLNSAPVQLLPIDYGGSSKNISEKDSPDVRGESFNDVLHSVSRERAKDSVEKMAEKTAAEKDGGRNKLKSDSEKTEKSGKSGRNEDAEKTAAAAQEIKPEEAVKSGKKEDLEKALNGFKSKGGGKSTVRTGSEAKVLKKVSDGAAEKAVLTGAFAGMNGASGEKPGKQLKAGKSSGKGKEEAVSALKALAGKTASSAENTAGVGSSVKPSIQLAAAGKETGKEHNALKKTGKLKISDHRRNVSASAGKGVSISASTEGSSFKNEIDTAGRIIEMGNAADNASDSARNGVKTAETRNMQSSLLSQLKDSVNSEIVKQAGVIVKGDGTGEIKLVMKPESLGKVRIQLSLNDNHIAGRIFVENNIVREIFESNLENLYKAFGSEGFEAGSLEVSVQGEGGQADAKGRRNGRGFAARAVKTIEEAVPEIADSEWRNNAVNMVV